MLFFIIAYGFTLVIALIKHGFVSINFLTFSNAIFISLVFPKIIGFFLFGNSVFLTLYGVMDDNAAYAASYITFVFMLAINLAYIVARVAAPKKNIAPVNPPDFPQEQIAWSLNLYFILPISVFAILVYFWAAGVSLDQLITKRDWGAGSQGMLAYASQKAAQFAKVGFYIAILGSLSATAGGGSRHKWHLQALVFAILLILVFLSSSQRSGVFLLVITAILVLRVLGKLKVKHIVITFSLFLVINSIILASRFVDGMENLSFFEVFTRRYFFEVEKISAIFEYSVSDGMYLFSPVSGLFSTSTATIPDYNIHYFIGTEMFGLSGLGIPPSILGEIILYFGPIYVLPITFLLALGLARSERLLAETMSVYLKLFLIVLLANSYFLLLNSDILSLARRMVFDSGFIAVAFFFFSLSRSRKK